MSEKKMLIPKARAPDGTPPRINWKAVEQGLQAMSDTQLQSLHSFVRELGGSEPLSAHLRARRVFERYWAKYRNREAN
jgi:hypothetical protein